MRKLNVVLSILVALLLMTACNGDIKSSDTTEPPEHLGRLRMFLRICMEHMSFRMISL